MRALVKSAKRATVIVSGGKVGSGFVVRGGYVVTCAHVLDGAASASVSNAYLGSAVAQVVELDEGHDLAVLRLNLTSVPCLELGTYGEFDEGDEVVFLGYPLGMNMHTTHRGIVSYKGRIKFDDLPEPVDAFSLDAAVNRGNSGGPVLAAETGAVVGIVNTKLGELSKRLKEFRGEQEIVRASGLRSTVQFGVVKFADGRQVKAFDAGAASDALAEVIDFLDNYTNAGIGYAISVDYVRQLISTIDGQKEHPHA